MSIHVTVVANCQNGAMDGDGFADRYKWIVLLDYKASKYS